jgi:hypothetical protein
MPMRSMKHLRMVLLAEMLVLLPALLLPAGIQSKELQSKETRSTVQRGRTRIPQEGQSVRQDCKDAGNSEPIRASKVGFSGNRAIPTCIEGACKEKPQREPDGHQGHLLSRLALNRTGFLPCTCIATIPNPSQPQSKTRTLA